jgi:hypothetical protein
MEDKTGWGWGSGQKDGNHCSSRYLDLFTLDIEMGNTE